MTKAGTSNPEYEEKRTRAMTKVFSATKKGILTRPDTCELCGNKPAPKLINYDDRASCMRPMIYAHHWRGYDYPLDVWFICQPCNRKLIGEQFHNGSITKEQARDFILNS